jgi:hypothetical protein
MNEMESTRPSVARAKTNGSMLICNFFAMVVEYYVDTMRVREILVTVVTCI